MIVSASQAKTRQTGAHLAGGWKERRLPVLKGSKAAGGERMDDGTDSPPKPGFLDGRKTGAMNGIQVGGITTGNSTRGGIVRECLVAV